MDTRRTADRNALTALLRSFDLGIDARKAVTDAQIRAIAAWRTRSTDDTADATIRDEARQLATSVLDLGRQLRTNRAGLSKHVEELAPGLLEVFGLGPVTAAAILAAYSHKGRVHSEAAFAALAGAAPIPASSGNTVRYRLNRHGDRQLNQALDVIAKIRSVHDAQTRDYIERRMAQGKSHREIRRCLKRYIARQMFRRLNSIMT
ncbi:transposase [Subtercola vilae]|uniref:IS110 family transposase n=1 Tax=Subtercola vilae TaxID=2056433 RepID=A0A4T2BMC0_9MICO|nr:transposase [Subtercola vilae]TIH30466.1 IS110 family transposase [Subtercola vilae]